MDRKVFHTTKAMPMAVTWTLLILAFLSNFLFMAGLASLQYACNYNFFSPTMEVFSAPAAFGLSNRLGSCGSAFRFYWFGFAFTFITLVGAATAAATCEGLRYSRSAARLRLP